MDRMKLSPTTPDEPRLVVAGGNRRRRPKRSSRACARCHRRKVRCDGAISGFPCTNCRLDQYPCTLQPTLRQTSRVKQLSKAPIRSPQRGTLPQAKYRSNIGTITKGSLLFDYPCLDASGLKRLTHEKIVLLETQGCLRVPSRHALDALVKHYFLYVHPCLPLLDEAAFWREYRCTKAGGSGISIVLFRAMLFAASPLVPVEVAQQCGHETLLLARDDLYRRAKLLYESGAETDPLTIAQTTLLLSYYTTDSETSTNSTWLEIAIESAKEGNAHIYYSVPSPSGTNSTDLKRVWWCCLIRDRLISLGMRRPIQITPDEYDLPQQGLTFADLEDEAFHSEVYGLDTKTALSQVLASLCHFAVTVTDMAMIVYPTVRSRQSDREDPRKKIEKLERAKSALLKWELNWLEHMEGKDFYLHSSLALCCNLLSIYYQSARMAVSNHMCRLITMVKSLEYEDLKRIEACRSDLVTAIGSTAQKVKEFIIHGVADKLPISAVAYTMLPQILLSIESELSKTPEDKQKREVMLVLFVEINRIFSSRYYTRRILDITWRALQLCQKASLSDEEASRTGLVLRADCSPVLFELRLTHYVRLLRYIDEVMSTLDHPVEKVSMLCPVDLALSDHVDKLGPSIPTWMQSIEETYLGREALHTWSSSLFLSWSPADDASNASADSSESNEDADAFQQILECLPLLGE
ncbi:hypothetical protein ATEIFO6365_0009005900 [Aspergillus terreus]|uniref:Uncharacterized protein n=1 Tax=Aspergillus terreus TaxID=33178 RepID=A0A5M3Z7C3_ASPTE|nr:hypothetical protein ATETN484_0011005900 [Aspergillus terreus]GFF18696.1 hypothetical protein ATEIFO6365_0009005900 [Aspergillus terreus]